MKNEALGIWNGIMIAVYYFRVIRQATCCGCGFLRLSLEEGNTPCLSMECSAYCLAHDPIDTYKSLL
jgi:hypothetical protein